MKWYFASRTRHRENLVSLSNFLEAKGETVLSHWIHVNVATPFEQHLSASQQLAAQVVEAILEADIFILVSDPEGTDMFVELGVSLAKKQKNSVKIYIVGEHSRRSLMQVHPDIVHMATMKGLFERENIDCKNFNFPEFR